MGVRVYPKVRRVYLDQDGPLADFDFYCNEVVFEHPVHVKRYAGTYLNLPVTDGALAAVKLLTTRKDIDVWVLSKAPSENLSAASEKHYWLDKHFPILAGKLIITPDKGCVGKFDDFLIDDHPEWANANNFGGEVIRFKTNLMAAGMNWEEILEFLDNRLKTP